MLTLLLAHNVIESSDTLFCTRYHNQADDIVCTLTSAPITAKSISPFCLQREVENMRHALAVSNGYKLFLNCEEID